MKETVSEWFSGMNNFRMSDVQREYVWEKQKAIDLLNSLQEHESNFLGGVAYREEKGTNKLPEFVISDGCQRLTTLLLIIKAYGARTEMLNDLKNKKLYFSFANQKDAECLQKIFESNSLNDLVGLGDLGKRPIIKNYRALKEIADKDSDRESTISNVVHTKLFGMEIPEDCDEVDVFVNLNSKGKAVKPSEMIKAYFPDGDGKYGTYNEISNSLNNINETYMEKFLKCEMFANKKQNSISVSSGLLKFYEEFSKTTDVFSLKEHSKLFENIMSNRYTKLLNGKNLPIYILAWLLKIQIEGNPDSDRIINLVLRWLYFNCPYISVLSSNNNKFQGMEEKIFISTNGGLPSNISYEEVKEALKSIYSNAEVIDFKKNTSKGLSYKLGAPFIISVFEDLKFNMSHLTNQTVEHIYAQNCVLGEIDEQHLHCFGNLTLLGQKLNSSVGNKPPVEKFKTEAYKISGFKPTLDLMDKTAWTLEDIENRHTELFERWFDSMMKEI